MKIMLINPPSDTHYVVPPLGLGYLAAACKSYHPLLLDCQKRRYTTTALARQLSFHKPDVVGIQTFSCDIAAVNRLLHLIKHLTPQTITIIGGAHPSGVGARVLTHNPHLDYAFQGECELALPRFLELLDSSHRPTTDELIQIPGLIFRDQNEIRANPRQIPQALDQIPFPLWELMDPRTYPLVPQGAFYKQAPIAPMITSRGCPFPCTFCASHTLTGKKLRMRSTENVMEEIRYLKKRFGIRELHFLDDTFTSSKKRILQLCESLKGQGLSFTMPNGVRLDTLDDEMLRAMKEAGCYSLILGIESGSQRILDHMKKKTTLEQIRHKVHLIRQFNIDVRGFFIIGYPTETPDDIMKTIQFACSLPLKGAHFSSFLPLPGTMATKELQHQGLLNSFSYEKLFYAKAPFTPPGFEDHEIPRWVRRAYFSFYLRPTVLWEMLRQVRSIRQFYALVERFVDYTLNN